MSITSLERFRVQLLRCASIQPHRIWHLAPLSLECKCSRSATLAGTFLGFAYTDAIARLYKMPLLNEWNVASLSVNLPLVCSSSENVTVEGVLFFVRVRGCM